MRDRFGPDAPVDKARGGEARRARRRLNILGASASYVATVAICAAATGICFAMHERLAPANLIMIYLLGVAAVATRYGLRESVLASVLSIAAFDFFFVPPYYTLNVADTEYLLTFAIMLVVALMLSGLTLRLRRQAALWQSREHRSSVLYHLSRNLAMSRSTREIAAIGASEIGEVFGGEAAVFIRREEGALEVLAGSRSGFEDRPAEQAVANWVAEKAKPAGVGADTFPDAAALYVPLVGARGVIGVLAVQTEALVDGQNESLLETFANGLALALERTLLAKESHLARLSAESEKMRNVLLNSVSHDLRTPLTVIGGAASSLAEGKGDAKELAQTIVTQSERLNRHVQNLLDMTRLEASTIEPNLEWHSIEELIGAALGETEGLLQSRKVKTFIPPGMALVKVDGMLVGKALVNLLENAARHTPDETDIEVRVSLPGNKLRIQVADHGPGIPAGEEERIFDKFYQPGGASRADRGFGLGLAICKAVAEAHGGRVWAENRPGGGTRFYLELSTSGQAPEVPFD